MRQILEDRLNSLIAEIRGNMGSKGVNASGTTAQSLGYELTDTRIQVFGSGGLLWLETGRPPYSGGPDSNLKGKILDWMPYRGIGVGLTEAKRKGLAYIIANNINDFGTRKWQQFGSKGNKDDIYSTPIDTFVKELEEIVYQEFLKNVQSIHTQAN